VKLGFIKVKKEKQCLKWLDEKNAKTYRCPRETNCSSKPLSRQIFHNFFSMHWHINSILIGYKLIKNFLFSYAVLNWIEDNSSSEALDEMVKNSIPTTLSFLS